MNLFVAVASLVFIVVGTAVGVRIILRARADRSLPELAVGAALVAFCGITQPLSIARVSLEGQIPLVASSALQVTATLSSAFATLCLYLFTWRVFRPHAQWAALLFAGGSALGLWAGAGMATVSFYDSTFQPQLAGKWIALSAVSYAVCFGWVATESLLYFVQLRRRLRLGLAEPELVNRFLLWGGACAVSFVVDLVLMAYAASGADFNRDLTVRLLVSFSGLVQVTAWFLSFTPPARYVRFVRRRGRC